MGRLRVLSGREVRHILEAHGFTFVRQRGSHIIVRGVVDGVARTVPVPDHKEVAAGTLRDIIRQSGLPRAIFEA